MGRKVNKALKDWVGFVKRVQDEEHITYPKAIKRAKTRKNKGEKWRYGGSTSTPVVSVPAQPVGGQQGSATPAPTQPVGGQQGSAQHSPVSKGGRRCKTAKKQKSGRRKTSSKK